MFSFRAWTVSSSSVGLLLVVILKGGAQQEIRTCLHTERHSCKSKVLFLTIYVKEESESISILLSDAYLQECFLNISKHAGFVYCLHVYEF